MTDGGSADSIDVSLARAGALADLRRHDEAIQLLERIALDGTDDNRISVMLAAVHLDAGRPDDAERWSRRAIRADPTEAQALELCARSLLAAKGREPEALELARQASIAAPDEPQTCYTLVRAQLAVGRRDDAQDTARHLRRIAPWSLIGPLADALVELHDSGVFQRRRWTAVGIVVVTLATRGLFLVFIALAWIVHAVRRAPHLRRADEHLRAAMELAPDNASLHALTAQVLTLRFRYAQAADREVTAAALDIGLADADAVAEGVARRNAIATAVAVIAWFAGVIPAINVVGSDLVVGALSAVIASGAIAAVAWFDRWQTKPLPPALADNARGRWPPLVVALVAGLYFAAGLYVATIGNPLFAPASEEPERIQVAALAAAPLVIGATIALTVRTWRARR